MDASGETSSSLSLENFEFYEDYVATCNARMKDLKSCRAIAQRRGNESSIKRIEERMKALKNEQIDAHNKILENESDEGDEEMTSTSTNDMSCTTDDKSDRKDGSNVLEAGINSTGESNEKNPQKGIREQKACPVPTCNATVIHLPRHLRNVHKWSEQRAKTALQYFNMRKLPETDTTHKDYHIRKTCPVTGCRSITKRISDHLLRVHKLDKNSEKYKGFLKSACKAWTGEHIFQKMKKEIKERKQLVEKMCTKSHDEEDLELDDQEQHLEEKAWEKNQEDCKNERNVINDDVSSTDSEYIIDEQFYSSEESCEENQEHCKNERNVINDDVSSTDSEYIIDEQFYSSEESCEESCEDSNKEITSKVFLSFKTWMKSPDGGKNDEKTADQHMKQLKRVLHIIDQKLEFTSLLDYKLIRDNFITEHAEQKYHPKTIKSYIMSIRHFYSYLIADEPASIDFDHNLVTTLRERLQCWTKSYKKDCNKREWRKKESDRDRLVKPSTVTEFEKSKAAREAIIILGQLSGAYSREITQGDFTLVRDFLFAEIAIDNANRAGVVANMTTREFDRAICMEEGESFIVEVMKHKTLESKGPANVVMSKKLYSWIKIYRDELRKEVCRDSSNKEPEELFLSWNGKKLESSQVNKALKSVWKKANIESPICSNDFRKGAVTEIHSKHKGYSSNLADLLDHSESTAGKYYCLTSKNNSALIASKHLAKVMRSEGNTMSCPKKKEEVKGTGIKSTASSGSGQDDPQSSRKLPWSAEAEKVLQTVFADEIVQRNVSMEDIRKKIADVPILVKENPRRVLDKVRAQWRYTKKASENTESNKDAAHPPNDKETCQQRVNRIFDDEESGTVISETLYSCSMKGIFSESESKRLVKICNDMITSNAPIAMKVISERLNEDTHSKKILSALSMKQIVNRIKYEFRMHRERTAQKKGN